MKVIMLKKKIGTLKDLSKNNQFSRWINDHDILVYKNNDKIEAISNICPHFGGPILYKSNSDYLLCPWHGLEFDFNGKCTNDKN